MRIGIDVRLWQETGVGRYIRNLVSQLVHIDKDNEYVLFALANDIEEIRILVPPNWEIVTANIHWHTFEEQRNLPKILDQENLDLIHFPYFSVPVFYSGKFVVTIHDLIIDHFDTGEASTKSFLTYKAKRFAYQQVLKTIAKKAIKIITVSNATKQEILEHYKVSSDKIVVTYEGVEERVKGKEESVSPLTPHPYFLYVGNAYPHKNLDRLIDAFVQVKSQIVDIKLVMVGKEDYFYKKLKEKVKRIGLEEVVVFRGFVSDEELSTLYEHAVATVIPSLMEGFGLPALEAMSRGSLVLASDIASLREVLDTQPFYFSPIDLSDMTKKMVAVANISKKEREEKIKKGALHIKQFSWKKMAEETLEIYESSVSIRQS